MPLIRNISIGFGARMTAFVADIQKATAALEKMAEANDAAQKASGGGAGGAGGAGGGEAAGAIGASMAAGMSPLLQIGVRIEAMLDRIGGTVVTAARRMDSSIKFNATQVALDKLETQIDNVFGEGATDAVRFGLKVKAMFANMGDVAGKSLSRIMQLKSAFVQMPAPIAQASTAVKGLGVQIGMAFGMVGLIFTATLAIKNFFATGIKGAMNLGETMSKTKEVFGASTDAVVANANQMAKAFGLSKGAILDASASFGLIAQGAGVSQEKAATLSTSLAQLAADASSFYNVPIDTALEKIRSGLVGEAEPLRAFGVLLSEDAVKAEAAAMGIDKVKGKLDEQTKVMARASLIQKGLATASGDLARTQDSVANQFRKSGGGIQNFAVSMGELLLPAINAGTLAVNELLSSIVETFENNKDVVTGWANKFTAGIDSVVKSVRYFSDYWAVAQLSATQQTANFLAYLDVIPENLGKIADYIGNTWANAIVDAFNYIGRAMFDLLANMSPAKMGQAVGNMLKGEGFKADWSNLTEGFTATMAEFPELARPALIDLSTEMANVFAGIEAKEAARKAAVAPIGAAKKAAVAGGAAAAGDGAAKEEGIAALTAGSSGAASALAKFFNKSAGDTAAKETANNTKTLVEIEKKNAESYGYLLRALSDRNETALAVANL